MVSSRIGIVGIALMGLSVALFPTAYAYEDLFDAYLDFRDGNCEFNLGGTCGPEGECYVNYGDCNGTCTVNAGDCDGDCYVNAGTCQGSGTDVLFLHELHKVRGTLA